MITRTPSGGSPVQHWQERTWWFGPPEDRYPEAFWAGSFVLLAAAFVWIREIRTHVALVVQGALVALGLCGAALLYAARRRRAALPPWVVSTAVTAVAAAVLFMANGGAAAVAIHTGMVLFLTLQHGAAAAALVAAAFQLGFLGVLPGGQREEPVMYLALSTGAVCLGARVLALHRTVARRRRYLGAVLASARILSHLDLDETLDQAARQVVDATGADTCVIFLADPDQQTLHPKAIACAPRAYNPAVVEAWQRLSVRFGQGMTGWVAVHRQPILTGDAERDPRAEHLPGTPVEDESAMLVPLVVQDRLLGVIRADRAGLNQFTLDDLRLLEVMANHAAIAVERARLYQETRAMAMTDPLTGVYNRHYFNRAIEPRFAAAHPDEPVAVLMVDLYDFKRVNDTWGHTAGDELLRAAGALLRQSVRTTDIVVRYGGDEFVLVLPGAGRQEAEAVAQRIQTAVARFNAGRPPGSPQLILNIGLAAATGGEWAALLARADAAMYAAKRSERNRRSGVTSAGAVSPSHPTEVAPEPEPG